MIVKSYMGQYEAEFYTDFSFFEELKGKTNKFFIIDKKVYSLYEETLKELVGDSSYYLLEAVEENKNVEKALEIISEMVEMKSKRNTLLVAVGGGIVQDVSAFIANILYRGISWALIPTTLLAQTDSCIGSKTSLNYKQYKNLLGYFYPPTKIYINTQFVQTLEHKDYCSGLGEIMKCAMMAGYNSFCETCANIEAMVERKEDVLVKEIKKALNFKKGVIEIDEFDTNYRNIMNFGHTFGHALESTSKYVIPHGQAVSFGMMVANRISCERGYISEDKLDVLNSAIAKVVTMELLKKEYFVTEEYLAVMKKDKKYTGTYHTCILFTGDGVERYSDVTDEEIINAIEKTF